MRTKTAHFGVQSLRKLGKQRVRRSRPIRSYAKGPTQPKITTLCLGADMPSSPRLSRALVCRSLAERNGKPAQFNLSVRAAGHRLEHRREILRPGSLGKCAMLRRSNTHCDLCHRPTFILLLNIPSGWDSVGGDSVGGCDGRLGDT